ncbi:MAG: nucleoside monophosphate kinase [Blastochloris sp.]|jgi:adenylate kinase|nr:nucleoside monophosphate kinase [Blastochloris sp.]
MEYRAFLIFGAPGSGKGTQGKILGTIPGFFHLACGDVFRSLDLRSEVGRAFIEYSSRGELVPNDITIKLWKNHLANMVTLGRFKPDLDHLVLDGIPRNLEQARILEGDINVKKVFHLDCPNRELLVERMRRRALKDNRFDDANEDIIRVRLQKYLEETKPVLDYYGTAKTVDVDAMKYPYEVLREILKHIHTLKD